MLASWWWFRVIRNLFIKNSNQENQEFLWANVLLLSICVYHAKMYSNTPTRPPPPFGLDILFKITMHLFSKMFLPRWLQPSCSSPPNFLRPHAHHSQRKLKLDIFLVWKRLAKIKQELKYCYNLTPLLLFIFQPCL